MAKEKINEKLYVYPCETQRRKTCLPYKKARSRNKTLEEFCNANCKRCNEGRVFNLSPDELNCGQNYAFGLKIHKEMENGKTND